MVSSNISRLAVGQSFDVYEAVVHPKDRRGGVNFEVKLRGRRLDRRCRRLDRFARGETQRHRVVTLAETRTRGVVRADGDLRDFRSLQVHSNTAAVRGAVHRA